jgi:hypothetical protein
MWPITCTAAKINNSQKWNESEHNDSGKIGWAAVFNNSESVTGIFNDGMRLGETGIMGQEVVAAYFKSLS